jgi:hypothetical protein
MLHKGFQLIRLSCLLKISLNKPEARSVDGLVADYSKSAVEVFAQVGRMMVQAEGDSALENWLTGEADDLEGLKMLSCIRPSRVKDTANQTVGHS